VFNELKKTSNEVIPVYINCWSNQTTHTIALELANKSGLLFPPKGVPTDEIIKNALNKLKQKRGLVICLDEADRLKELSILYMLVNELNNASIILITNHSEWKQYLEPRLTSRLNLKNLEFKEYTKREMNDIMNRRAKTALRQGVIDNELIGVISDEAGSDVRRGMALLIESVRQAERDASRKVLKKHLNEALKRIKDKVITELSDEEEIIFKSIKENNGEVSGKVYGAYLEGGGKLSMRSFRRYIKTLLRAGLIKTEETGEGFQGKSRKLWIVP
jgi:Cdc6-like AAA superfamily ATPase